MQAQLQSQWQSKSLTMENLSPEAICAALRAALGSETSLPRIRNPAPNDLKPLLHKLLSLMDNKTEEDTAGMHQVKRALADLDAAQLTAMQAQHLGEMSLTCLLYTFDAADEKRGLYTGGSRINKKKK